MRLLEMRTAGFRNLAPRSVEWSPGTNLLTGANGQGKTNYLEAVAVLGNLRSFRASSMRQVVTHGASGFHIEGRVATSGGTVRLAQEVTPGPPMQRVLRVAGASATVPSYLGIFPVFAISGNDRELVTGGPSERRAFLDRSAFLLDKRYFNEIKVYKKTLKQRNVGLIRAIGDREMEAWEGRLAAAAARVVDRRRTVCRHLAASFRPIYDEIRGDGFPRIELAYRGEPGLEPAEKVSEVEEYYQKRYNETRTRDRRAGFTGEGPHRHDLGLRADGRTVRHMLSSGQVKMVAAALRLASLKQVENERGELLPVIVDDVDAELDRTVLAQLIGHLGGQRQLFLSSADIDVFEKLGAGSSRFEIRHGGIADPAGERTNE